MRNPVFREVELNSERRHSNVANSENFYSNEVNEFDGQSGKATPATTHRLSNAIARKPLQPYQNVYFSVVDTDGGESWNESKTSEPSDDAYEVPMRARFETNTSEENEVNHFVSRVFLSIVFSVYYRLPVQHPNLRLAGWGKLYIGNLQQRKNDCTHRSKGTSFLKSYARP